MAYNQYDRSKNENLKFVQTADQAAVITGSAIEILKVDDAGAVTYIGNALPGTATSAASWRIKRITDATGDIVWADGNGNYDNIWDNRAALSYS